MPNITIYTTKTCPFCHAAKRLLNAKSAAFTEIDVTGKPEERHRMVMRANGRQTVPQIFVGEKHVGGSDDLHELERNGKLDALLAAS